MNREIKFRAWDNSQNYMAYQGTPDLETIESFIFHFGDKELMQFIGLNDMNGKEIYEGDIVCHWQYERLLDWRGVIKFSHGVFGTEWLIHVKNSATPVYSCAQNHNLRKLDDDITETMIVIGNIYENPELLIK